MFCIIDSSWVDVETIPLFAHCDTIYIVTILHSGNGEPLTEVDTNGYIYPR